MLTTQFGRRPVRPRAKDERNLQEMCLALLDAEGEVGLGRAALAAMPYWLLMLVGVVLLTLFPGIALVLPRPVF